MILIVCVDDNNGMAFNKRRQSRDKILTEKICETVGGGKLWIKKYSEALFEGFSNVYTDEDCLKNAKDGEFCFIEDVSAAEYEEKTEKVILCKWNRRYPADLYFGIDLSGSCWELEESEEFAGNSHDKITMETYVKKGR